MKLELRSLIINIIEDCNLNCKHCYNRHLNQHRFMPVDKIMLAAKKCIAYGINRIYLTGGEPLLYPYLLEALQVLVNSYPTVQIGITTNGTLLTSNILDEISNIGNIVIQISVDGAYKETYERIRGKGQYDKFINGFNLLSKSRLNKVTARTCVSAINYNEIGDILRMCHDAGIEPSLIAVEKSGNGVDNWKSLEMSDSQKLHVINQVNNFNHEMNMNVSVPIPAYKCSFTQIIEQGGLESGDYGAWSLDVKCDGETACCRALSEYSIGNIFNESIEDMFRGKEFNDILIFAKKQYNYLNNTKFCDKCNINQTCGRGCIGMSFLNHSLGQVDGECSYRQNYAIFKALKLL